MRFVKNDLQYVKICYCSQKFIYDRFIGAKFTKNGKELLHPVNALGSCPAKRFTHSHIKLFVISMLTAFDMELQTDSDDHKYEFPDEVRLLSEDVTIRYRARKDVTEPLFSSEVSNTNSDQDDSLMQRNILEA